MGNATAVHENQERGNVSPMRTTFDLTPQSLKEAMEFAEILSRSDIVPKDFQNKPGNILVAMQWGLELGLKPMQCMQNIAVINGRPSLWGDAVIALVRNSPQCEYIYENEENGTATCRVKRRGEDEQVRTFSEKDAEEAGLLGKAGPWKQYKSRMKQMRARAFALRDVFADILKGIPIAEEVQDYQPIERVSERSNLQIERKELPQYPDEDFEKNFNAWAEVVKSGKRTAEQIVAMVSSKAQLTKEQRDQVLALEGDEA